MGEQYTSKGLVLEISARTSGRSTGLGSTGCLQSRLAREPVIWPEKDYYEQNIDKIKSWQLSAINTQNYWLNKTIIHTWLVGVHTLNLQKILMHENHYVYIFGWKQKKTEIINFHLSLQIKYLQGFEEIHKIKHFIFFTEIDVGWVCLCQSVTWDFWKA